MVGLHTPEIIGDQGGVIFAKHFSTQHAGTMEIQHVSGVQVKKGQQPVTRSHEAMFLIAFEVWLSRCMDSGLT